MSLTYVEIDFSKMMKNFFWIIKIRQLPSTKSPIFSVPKCRQTLQQCRQFFAYSWAAKKNCSSKWFESIDQKPMNLISVLHFWSRTHISLRGYITFLTVPRAPSDISVDTKTKVVSCPLNNPPPVDHHTGQSDLFSEIDSHIWWLWREWLRC